MQYTSLIFHVPFWIAKYGKLICMRSVARPQIFDLDSLKSCPIRTIKKRIRCHSCLYYPVAAYVIFGAAYGMSPSQ